MGGKRIDEYAYGTMTATCPECANILYGIFKKKYCDSCGQKIDWSVEE